MESYHQSKLNVENDDSKEYFWEIKGELDYVDKWFLMGSPVPILLIFLSYLIFVLRIGPEHMKQRKPYRLTNVLTIYNTIQVILSFTYFISSSRVVMSNGLLPTLCSTETEESKYALATITYSYFLCKIVDLLDTIFFVLRKKQTQVTFLHVYHHSFILLGSWVFIKYEPGYNMVFLGVLNSFVHTIMYTYYGLSAYPNMTKYLWWKKYITKLQLTQFILILVHFAAIQLASHCRPSYILTSVVWSHGFLFLYLFGKFYVTAYLKDTTKKPSEKDSNTDVKNTNGYKVKTSKRENSNEYYNNNIKDNSYTDVYKFDATNDLQYINDKTGNKDDLLRRTSYIKAKKSQNKI